jgi:hypothetical protein
MCEPCRPYTRAKRFSCKQCGASLDKAPGDRRQVCEPCVALAIAQKAASRAGSEERIASNRRAAQRRAEKAGRTYLGKDERDRLAQDPAVLQARRDKRHADRIARERRIAEAAGREHVPRIERERLAAAAKIARAAERAARTAQRQAEKSLKPWLAPGLTATQRVRIRRDNDRDFDVACRLRDQLRRADPRVKARKMGARLRDAMLARNPSRALHKRLGYTIAELVARIEALFTPGMTWELFRAGEIHLDHRLPLKLFDCTTDEGIRAAWALSNLQPLWAADNQTKHAKVLFKIPDELLPVLVQTKSARGRRQHEEHRSG